MYIYPKIPEGTYENRCKYCIHFQKEGVNRDYDASEIFSYSVTTPCRILGVSGYSYQTPLFDGYRLAGHTEVLYPDGECRTFTPHLTYPGICRSCRHHNCFAKEIGYCFDKKASDYKKVFIANNHGSEAYESDFYTCSNWEMKEEWKDLLLRDLSDGKVPAIIDPNTFKLLKPKKQVKMSKPKKQKIELLKFDV